MKKRVKSNLYPIQVSFGKEWSRQIVFICHCFDEKTQKGSKFGINSWLNKNRIKSNLDLFQVYFSQIQ